MDFEYSDEQRMLFDQVDRLGTDLYPPTHRTAPSGEPDRRGWKALAELGLLALAVEEKDGGIGGTAIDVMAVMEAFGRHLIPEPFVATCILAPALLGGGKHGDILGRVMAGDVRIAPAFLEAESGFALDRVETKAARRGGDFVLTGAKVHSEDGGDADYFLASARTAGGVAEAAGISLFVVPADATGLGISRSRSVDHHRHARLTFDEVVLGPDALVGEADAAFPAISAAVDRAVCAHLAEAVGSMDALVATTLDYLKTRQQFGVAIGTFQALQHRMVDVAIAAEEARSMAYHATLHLDRPDRERTRAVAAGKARIGQTSLFVGRQSVQLHGGVGATSELIVSHHLKRLMMIDLAYGDATYQVGRFASA